ncbi:hypothetical protein EC957_009180 [Mortierella hygrophila]|uniref:DIS3-like exonuclease 2 n=1 Tax=Mortierella hygrophila TaxID=979708 RepID=A0A9P6FJ37_9FUNG|nr:hypothetical protein EC957_009180 [Mortierella hygrophila]
MDNTTTTTPAPAPAPAAAPATTTTTTTTNTPPPSFTSTSTSSAADNTASTASTTTTAASKNKSQRAPRKEKSDTTTTGVAPNSSSGNSNSRRESNKDKENRPPKKDKTNGGGASSDNLNDASNSVPATAGAEQAASTTTTNNSRNNRRQSSKPKSRTEATAGATNPVAADGAAAPSSASSDHVSDPVSSKKPQSDETKKSRNSNKKQAGKTGNSRASSATIEGGEASGVVVPTPAVDGQVAAPLTPKRNERLSTSVNGSGNERRKSTTTNNNTNNINQGKKRNSNNNNKEPAKSAVGDASTVAVESEATSTSADPAGTHAHAKKTSKKSAPANKEGSAAAAAPKTKSNAASRSQGGHNGTRQSTTAAPKDRHSNKGAKDHGTSDATQPSKEGRPSSISSSCSFVTSSSSLSPSSPLSPASPSSSFPSPSSAPPTAFTGGNKDAPVTGISTKDLRRESAHGRGNRAEITRIKTNVPRDGASPISGPLGGFPVAHSPLTAASPSSRRSSALTPHGDKFGRLGGLPTVEENAAEKPAETVIVAAAVIPESSTAAHTTAPRRGHARTLSMKEQLDQLGQDTKEGKTIESLQDIISSLKSLPPTTSSINHPDHPLAQGTTRHEKRLSMSSLPANAAGHFSGGAVPSTTLHLSQPPRGTTIENALQSTVATLRRLSISDSKRPLIPLNEEESQGHAPTKSSNNNRRSVAFTKDIAPIAESFDDNSNKRTSSYQPNRRSVIIRPEEVAALQEGRQYVPSAFSFSSDDEPENGVADALSALEGKGTTSNRSSYSVKSVHQRTSSSVDPASLAEFAATLPSHLKSLGAAVLVNNDDAHDRRRFTTAFAAGNRTSTLTSSANKRLSAMNAPKDSDRKDWRMSTPMSTAGNRDSIYGKDNANGRRPLFMAHLTYSDFHTLLTKQKNKYVQGVLRINKRNRSDAYVTVDSLPEGDVYICGSKDRNRALEGDVVGIELIDPEEHPPKTDGKDKKTRRTEEGEEVVELESDEVKPKYCGRVVSIVERSISQMFSGTLTLQRPSGSSKKNDRKKLDEEDQKGQPRIVWFKPTDKRVPLIAIPIDQAPNDFVDNHAHYVHKLFVATIKRWPLSSLHPFGQLERELGDIGNIEIETEALLADNNVTTTAFGEKVEKCLPELPWSIPEKELIRRRDLRKDCIFTIDPPTAKDLDDAVSISRLEDGTLEVGVHIADVSHFIKVGSALDREAKSRATTVYLVQKAIPMLPNILCEDLCSLNPNVDRLAFSVFWKMTEDGHVLGTSFSKSVIRSCAQLSYDDAQTVITTGSLDPKIEIVGQSRSLVEENIKIFYKLSQILRKNRFENGSLSINSIRLSFETDEIHNPIGVSVYELKESNRLIEEFMLLANMSVAKQIAEFLPDQALLRRHEEPLEKRMTDFISHMQKIGLDLDASSSGALQQSLDAIEDPDIRKVVRLLVIKPMQRAKYICAGMLTPDKYHHYALNAPLYTHFTSPIRRYADIIVHRMLEASLINDTKFYLSKESCQKSANHCNIKKDASKLAQEQSSHVYLSVLLRNMTEASGPVIKDAVIVQALDASFDVLVPEYGLEKRIYVDQLPLERHAWNSNTETLKLFWTTEAFKKPSEDAEESKADGKDKSRRSSSLPAANPDALDHPDDATTAYDDERGLFEDESDYDDDEDLVIVKSHQVEEDEDEAEGGDDEARRLTRIRMYGHLQVVVTADTTVSPPVIKVQAINPFAVEEPATAVVPEVAA